MGLRLRAILIIYATLFVLLTGLVLIGWRIVSDRYAQLERSEAKRETVVIENALRQELLTLNSIAGDYANWDDTYAFAAGQLPSYAPEITAESLLNLNADLLAIIDPSCNVKLAFSVERATRQPMALAPALAGQLGPGGRYCGLSDSSRILGIDSSEQGLLLVAARPILGNDAAGPVGGTFLIGRTLQRDELERVGSQFSLAIDIRPIGVAEAAELPESRWLEEIDGETLASHAVLTGIAGKPVALLTVFLPRGIHSQGVLSATYLLLAIIAGSVAFAVVTSVMIDRFVVRRITSLSSQVTRIASLGDLSLRVSQQGSDEVGKLSAAINEMLSALEETQTSLEFSREQFRSLIMSMEDIVFTLDRDTRFTSLYGQSLARYDLIEADYLGKILYELIDEDAAQLLGTAVAQAFDGHTTSVDWVLTGLEDRTIYFHTSLSPQRDAHRVIVGVVGVARDVTALRRLDKARGEFLGRISHELRTPLTGILGYAEILHREQTGPLNAVQRRCLERIELSSRQLELIVSDFSEIAQIESGRFQLKWEAVSDGELCAHAAASLESLAGTYGVTTHMQNLEHTMIISGDRRRLERAIDCLIVQALRRAGTGGEVSLYGAHCDGSFFMEIGDSGRPYTVAALATLFERVTRPTIADDNSAASYSGHELYVAKAIIDAHNGRLEVSSGVGGNTFRLTLPTAGAAQPLPSTATSHL